MTSLTNARVIIRLMADTPHELERPTRTARLTAADWVDAAIDALARAGLGAIAVEPLALRLRVTKGSFYAHFPTRDALIATVLERWEEVDTDQAIRDVQQIADPVERLTRLLELNFERPRWGRAFAALCATADDPRVKPFMDRVYRRRLTYFEQALLDLGVDPAEAEDRAVLIYTAYVGFWRVIAADPSWALHGAQRMRRYAAHVRATLIPGLVVEDIAPPGPMDHSLTGPRQPHRCWSVSAPPHLR